MYRSRFVLCVVMVALDKRFVDFAFLQIPR